MVQLQIAASLAGARAAGVPVPVGTIAGAALGSLIPIPGVGTAIGATIGAYVDNAFIFPALYPPEDVKGPRIGDLQSQGAEEGNPIATGFGPECKVRGQVIWMSPIIEVKQSSSVGGKGSPGGGGKTVTYQYFRHVAVALMGREIKRVKTYWANGKRIYDITPDISYSSALLTCNVTSSFTLDPAGGPTVYTFYLNVNSPNGGPDLSKLKSGKQVNIGGFTNANNNGVFTCISSSKDALTGTSTTKLLGSQAVVDQLTAGPTVTVFQSNPLHSTDTFEEVTFYPGNRTQGPDPTIEAYKGAGNTSAYRNTAYALFKNFRLTDYGNMFPSIEALCEADTSIRLSDVVTNICVMGGMDPSEVNTTNLSGTVRGYVINGPQRPTSMLQPLAIAYDFVTCEENGILTFRHRSQVPVTAIDPNRLAAHQFGEDTMRPFRMTENPSMRLARQVVVIHNDPDKDYQQGSQGDKRTNSSALEVATIDLNSLVLTSTEARRIANVMAWTAIVNSQRPTLRLPMTEMHLTTARRLTFTAQSNDWDLHATRVDHGFDWISEHECFVEDIRLLTTTVTAETAEMVTTMGGTQEQGWVPGYPELNIIECAPLRDEEVDGAGFYFTGHMADPRCTWRSAVLMESTDGGDNWVDCEVAEQTAVAGWCTGWTGVDVVEGIWDRVNELTVEVVEGTLASVTEDQCLNGQNRAAFGHEIIGFATAELVGERTYKLTNLLRGERDSFEWANGTHDAGERFVSLNLRGVYFHRCQGTAVGTTRLYKLVPAGAVLDEVPTVTHTLLGKNMQPFAPTEPVGTRDGSNNLTMTFFRRTRALYRAFSGLPVPVVERSVKFEVDAVVSGDVVRTLYTTPELEPSATDEYSVTYTAAEQTADGITPGDPVETESYQVNQTVGRGRRRTRTV